MHKYATALWILVLLTAVGCETISANGDGAAKQWWQDDGDVKTTSLPTRNLIKRNDCKVTSRDQRMTLECG